MKAFFLLTKITLYSVFIFLTVGCSSDNELNIQAITYQNYRLADTLTYDSLAYSYNTIYVGYKDMYMDSNVDINLMLQRVEELVIQNNIFDSHISIDQNNILSILNATYSETPHAEELLSNKAYHLFLAFTEDILLKQNENISNQLIEFQNIIRTSSFPNDNDLRILLRFCSVLKSHFENGGDDDDWADNGTTIMKAAFFGSKDSVYNALVATIVVRLIQEGY